MSTNRYRNDAGKELPAYETLWCPVDAGKGLPAYEIMEFRVGRHSHAAVSLTLGSRRAFILAAAAWPALAWTGVALAQSKKPPVVIGWLHVGSRAAGAGYLEAFKQGMTALGWTRGSNYVLEERWAEGQTKRLPSLAEEVKAKGPLLIVAAPSEAVVAAAKAAPRIPLVQANGGDLVAAGFAASLARPGGNVTGVTNIGEEVSGKYLELLLAAAPEVKHVGFLLDVPSRHAATYRELARRSATQYSVEAHIAEVARPEDLDLALSRFVKESVQGLVLFPNDWYSADRSRIVKLALAQRWPVIAGPSSWVEEGALLSYGANRPALYRRAAYFVDRILKGAKPGDLPIEQPTRFELVINMKTAKAIGITIPQSVLARADRVIE